MCFCASGTQFCAWYSALACTADEPVSHHNNCHHSHVGCTGLHRWLHCGTICASVQTGPNFVHGIRRLLARRTSPLATITTVIIHTSAARACTVGCTVGLWASPLLAAFRGMFTRLVHAGVETARSLSLQPHGSKRGAWGAAKTLPGFPGQISAGFLPKFDSVWRTKKN